MSKENTEKIRLEQDARIALLSYYSSECRTHGEYLIAMALLFIGTSELYYRLQTSLITNIIFSGILSLIFTGIVYLVGRILYWRHLTSKVIFVPYDQVEGRTLLFRLEKACGKYLRREDPFKEYRKKDPQRYSEKFASKFYTLRWNWLFRIWIIFWIIGFHLVNPYNLLLAFIPYLFILEFILVFYYLEKSSR